MQNMTHFRPYKLFLFVGIILVLYGCKKVEPFFFTDKDSLFFTNLYWSNDNSTDFHRIYNDTVEVSFHEKIGFQVDTLAFASKTYGGSFSGISLDDAGKVWVRLTGNLSEESRPFDIQVEGEGAKFCILPADTALYIPADTNRRLLDIRIKRPPLTDTSIYFARIKLISNSSFNGDIHQLSEFVYKFGNIPRSPAGWDVLKFGTFSYEKLQAITGAIRATDAMDRAAVLPMLKRYFSIARIETFFFPPNITIDNAYNIINKMVASAGPNTLNTNIVMDWITMVSIVYIAERAEAGSPMFEKDGKPITFPTKP